MTDAFLKFLDAIEKAKKELHCHDIGAWYRGVKSAKYRLYPSLLRPRSTIQTSCEREIFEESVNFEPEEGRAQGSWRRLVRLQQYGVPTRLLDWTEVFGVALFFAIDDSGRESHRSPSIWIINPFTIAEKAREPMGVKDKRIGSFHDETDMDYFVKFISRKKCGWPYQYPIPYLPPRLTPRIRAQTGFFTVHGVDRRPLDCIYRGHVRQVRLPSEAIPDARRFLDSAGIDSLSLFPDFEGFARRIQKRYQ